jgi:glycosyltransferase involved in cell wall biosynthesis
MISDRSSPWLFSTMSVMKTSTTRQRPLIAFFDYPDVFEDFYPHYGVTQEAFATQWDATGNHAFAGLLQREVGDVIWYAFTLKPGIPEATHARAGCRVRMVRSSWLHRALWKLFYMPSMAWRWKRLYPAYATVASYVSLFSLSFLRMLRHDRPDFFFVQDYATGRFDELLLLSRRFDAPLIAYHSGSVPDRYLGRLAKRWTIPRADHLIVSGSTERDMLERRYHVPADHISVILTPIDTALFSPMDRDRACRGAGLDASRRYLLFVGRLDDNVKRVGPLIRAFSVLARDRPTVDLVIVGGGDDEAMIRREAADQAPGRVHFAGWVDRKEVLAHYYNAAECLVLPSRSEGFPTVVGEAMACGLPVIATRVGGIGELVIDDDTGWLIPPDDEEALTRALTRVVTDPARVGSMRSRVRAVAEEHVSHAAVASQLRRVFHVPRTTQQETTQAI